MPFAVSERVIERLPIVTARLRIERFGEKHLTDAYVGWLNDPEVVRFSDQRFRVHTRDSCRHYLESFAGTANLFLALTTSDRHIGTMTAYVDDNHGVADLGILIGDRQAWGMGYGTEAWTAVCDALLEAGIRKITAGTLETNTGMRAIMSRAGMIPDGRRRGQCLLDGQPVDVVHAAIFRR